MRNVSHSVSILSLFLIAVDRFIATKYPLKFILLTKKIRASLLLSSCIGYCFPTFLYAVIDKVWTRIILQISPSCRQDHAIIFICSYSNYHFVFRNYNSVSAHHACVTETTSTRTRYGKHSWKPTEQNQAQSKRVEDIQVYRRSIFYFLVPFPWLHDSKNYFP